RKEHRPDLQSDCEGAVRGRRITRIERKRVGRCASAAVCMASALCFAVACGGPQNEERQPPEDTDSALTEPVRPTFDAGVKPTHDKFVGNITQRFQVPSDFGTYWNQITPENEGKWG